MDGGQVSRRRILQGAGAAGTVGVLGALGAPGTATADRDDGRGRWDIVSVDPVHGTVSAGGRASARANDGSRLTLTGSGTFVPGEADEVTGGGTWRTAGPVGSASGTYRVRALVRFDQAPGTFPAGLTDRIGDPAHAHAGLAQLRIAYSNGTHGVLTVSCHLVGTPDSVFEGVTASMGFVDFWNREAPQDTPFVDANRTLFHVVRRED